MFNKQKALFVLGALGTSVTLWVTGAKVEAITTFLGVF